MSETVTKIIIEGLKSGDIVVRDSNNTRGDFVIEQGADLIYLKGLDEVEAVIAALCGLVSVEGMRS